MRYNEDICQFKHIKFSINDTVTEKNFKAPCLKKTQIDAKLSFKFLKYDEKNKPF